MKHVLFMLAILSTLACPAANEVTMNPYGGLRMGGDFNLAVYYCGPNWSSNVQMGRNTLIAVPGTGTNTVDGIFHVSAHEAFAVRGTLEETGNAQWRYTLTFRSKQPVPGMLMLSMDIPVSRGFSPVIDGERRSMPAEYGGIAIYDTPKNGVTRSLGFQSDRGQITVSGEFSLRIQDNRHFKRDCYNVRIPIASGEMSEVKIALDIRLDTLTSVPVDLSRAANMGFADETADDGKGGWTDQGPENDLRCIPPGDREFSGIGFSILDPAKNGGKSCIVLSALPARRFPESRPVELARPETHEYLYLLHGVAWAPPFRQEVGRIRIEYDGAEESMFPVLNGIDVGNWWRPAMSYPNGLLLWSGDNRGGKVGLFGSGFPLRKAPVRRISFLPAGGVWMIAAASFTNLPLERPVEKPYLVETGKEWSPVTFEGGVAKGSPLDFSFLLDAPAGKYGRVIDNGQGGLTLEKQPGRKVRFWGTNLCQSALFPSHEEADKLAETLARNGYNSVRVRSESALAGFPAELPGKIRALPGMEGAEIPRMAELLYRLPRHLAELQLAEPNRDLRRLAQLGSGAGIAFEVEFSLSRLRAAWEQYDLARRKAELNPGSVECGLALIDARRDWRLAWYRLLTDLGADPTVPFEEKTEPAEAQPAETSATLLELLREAARE